MKTLIVRFLFDRSGATAIEYGMIAAMMSVAVIAAFPTVTTSLKTAFDGIAARFAAN